MRKFSVGGIAAALLVVLVAAVCIRLGLWQLDRLRDRRASNALIAAALVAPIIDLRGEALSAVLADPAQYRHRRVRLEGVYEAAGAFVLRGRAHMGSPGVHLVAPLRLAGRDSAILVDRGWLPAPDAASADPRAFEQAGTVAIEGLLHPLIPIEHDAQPVTLSVGGREVRSYQRLDPIALGAAEPGPLLPFYVQRTPAAGDPATPPLPDPVPALDDGPHLGYALQWFSFAAIAVVGFALVMRRERKRE